MRIISGLAGGTVLKSRPGLSVRPTADRVKGALFASLGDLRGWRVADLFAGTGALGLEACSRGAATVLLVERDAQALRCIRENIERVTHAIGGAATPDIRVLPLDVARVAERAAEFKASLDLILADPPYSTAPRECGAATLLRDAAFAAWAGGALLVLEHEVHTELPWAPQSPWRLVRQRRFGATVLSFARLDVGTPSP
ncbi:MAG: hypothetical protein A3K19_10040 [Lentisphaerae bacterium RIFOXYB12_FULL_65_16]|nr:MAG: hypothetical protein A3K18_27800 [Lentisphaerae bacterium RIFOXYA12_64_32]OGV91289.1 MAG: hypothetical protein A3K19_10040 [Lentisphaerae bacterium RIFOXYB12_FULL_65_16]